MESAGLVTSAPPSAPPDASELDAHERSFCEVYYRLHPRLLAVAERYVDHETARDAESAVLLDLWRRWPRLSEAQRSDRYIVQSVKNEAIDALKAQGVWTSIDDVEVEEAVDRRTAADHDATSRAESVAEVLEETLAVMPKARRTVLRLLREEQMTYMEAAKELGVSFGTIKSHYRHALAQLRAAYARAGHRVAQMPRALLTDPNGGADHD